MLKYAELIKATPHKARQKTLHVINLQIFRHITNNFLTIRQYAFKNSMQSDEKYICVSAAQAFCGVTLGQYSKIFVQCYLNKNNHKIIKYNIECFRQHHTKHIKGLCIVLPLFTRIFAYFL